MNDAKREVFSTTDKELTFMPSKLPQRRHLSKSKIMYKHLFSQTCSDVHEGM